MRSIVEEIREAERHFFNTFKIMPTALELDVESYALLLDEQFLDPFEEHLLWGVYKIHVNDYSEGKRIRFILSEDL